MLATTAGDLELRIPKLRAGSFFASLLERRRRVDQALFAGVADPLERAGALLAVVVTSAAAPAAATAA